MSLGTFLLQNDTDARACLYLDRRDKAWPSDVRERDLTLFHSCDDIIGSCDDGNVTPWMSRQREIRVIPEVHHLEDKANLVEVLKINTL